MLIASLKNPVETIPENVDMVELRLDLNPKLSDLIPNIKKPLILKTDDPSFNPAYFDCDWRSTPLRKTGIICSRHMDHTPKNLLQAFDELFLSFKADYYKLACHAHSTLDALRMLVALETLEKQGKPVIGLCMGELGQITRIAGAVSYAHLGAPTADGQLSVDELTSIYCYPRKSPWFGLIGDPIEQSISHLTHNEHLFFMKMRIHPSELKSALDLLAQLPFKGLAVTVPHKESIIPGRVVNTLIRTLDGWCGENTDGLGALDALGPIDGKKIALLGGGGCAKAIAKALVSVGVRPTIYNRTPKTIEHLPTKPLSKLSDYDILINATSCGMLSMDCPITAQQILPNTTIFETITKPANTTLVKIAKSKHCRIIYGKEMFLAQAKHQFSLWK